MVSLDLVSWPLSGHTCAVELSEGVPSWPVGGIRQWSSRCRRALVSVRACGDFVLVSPTESRGRDRGGGLHQEVSVCSGPVQRGLCRLSSRLWFRNRGET